MKKKNKKSSRQQENKQVVYNYSLQNKIPLEKYSEEVLNNFKISYAAGRLARSSDFSEIF